MSERMSVCTHSHDGHAAPATKCSHSRVLNTSSCFSCCASPPATAAAGCVLMSWHVASCWSHAWLALVLSNQRASACLRLGVCVCGTQAGIGQLYICLLSAFSCQLFIPTYENQCWLRSMQSAAMQSSHFNGQSRKINE